MANPASPASPQTPGPPKAEKEKEAAILAALLTATPNLRAQFFADPTRQAGKSLPPARFWDYKPPRRPWLPWNWYGSPFRYRKDRADLAKAILEQINDQVQGGDKALAIAASVTTDTVFEEHFAPIATVSRRSFTSVFYLSISAFVAGLCLIGVGTYIAIVPRTGTNSTVVASIFGGSGAVSALGAVYAMATRGIRDATLDHARLLLVLTAFATQLGQLRAIIEKPKAAPTIADAQKLNDAIGKAMKEALQNIPSPAEKQADASPPPGSQGANGSQKSKKNATAPAGAAPT